MPFIALWCHTFSNCCDQVSSSTIFPLIITQESLLIGIWPVFDRNMLNAQSWGRKPSIRVHFSLIGSGFRVYTLLLLCDEMYMERILDGTTLVLDPKQEVKVLSKSRHYRFLQLLLKRSCWWWTSPTPVSKSAVDLFYVYTHRLLHKWLVSSFSNWPALPPKAIHFLWCQGCSNCVSLGILSR